MSIVVEHLSHTYSPDSPFAVQAITDINLEIREGEFVGVIGHTGSGKSTLIQHLNGLEPAQSGRVIVDGVELSGHYDRKATRMQVGMVFQYPEQQLFEETVEKDICFGPKNLGLSEEEQKERAHWAMQLLGLDVQTYAQRSPFDLSGGQKRRVAIAGVLAMRPRYLVLDEPVAGLDPEGRKRLLDQIVALHKQTHIGIVLVSHSMDDIARCAQRVVVMHQGKLVRQGTPVEVFADAAYLQSIGLGTPVLAQLAQKLQQKGLAVPFSPTPEGMAMAIAQALNKEDGHA